MSGLTEEDKQRYAEFAARSSLLSSTSFGHPEGYGGAAAHIRLDDQCAAEKKAAIPDRRIAAFKLSIRFHAERELHQNS